MDDSRNIQRELTSLESEKRIDKAALKSFQTTFAERLNGSMGKDMKDVLSGVKKVKLPLMKRIKHKINMFLWHLNLGQ